jgi:hypothetical protein
MKMDGVPSSWRSLRHGSTTLVEWTGVGDGINWKRQHASFFSSSYLALTTLPSTPSFYLHFGLSSLYVAQADERERRWLNKRRRQQIKRGGLTCADRTRVIGILEQANSHLDPASSLTLHTTEISIEKDY